MTATQAMQAAAHSLGMTFEVQYAQREPLKTLDIAREMVARPAGKRPEYIVITDDYSVADRLLAIISPVRIIRAGSAAAVRCASSPAAHRAQLKSNVWPSTRPRIRPPRRRCFRIDIVKVAAWRCQAVKADFSRANRPIGER